MFEQRQMQTLLYQARGGKRRLESAVFIDPADLLDPETETRLREVETAGCAKVRKLFKQAVSINKFHSASWVAWAKFEQRQGNLDAARKLLVSGISNFPHSKNIAWFHCGLANIARQERDLNTARACYARALSTTAVQKTLPILLEYASMEADLEKLAADFDLRIKNITDTSTQSQINGAPAISVQSAATSLGQRAGLWPTESSQIALTLQRDKEAAIVLSVREARKLFETVVKRFPSEKRYV